MARPPVRAALESPKVSAKASQTTPITVVPATAESWRDIEDLFAQVPCWCQSWRLSGSEYGRASKAQLRERLLAERRNALRDQLGHSTPPGVIAYVEGQIVGWCGLGVRSEMERLGGPPRTPAAGGRPRR